MPELFLGVDAGGSTTRALVATAEGDVVGVGRAAGANMWSSGTSMSDSLGLAIRDALQGSEAGSVARGVIGLAGSLTAHEIASQVSAMWQGLELPGTPDIVPDVLAAFAAGTTAADGVVLVAGTGSIAAEIRDREVRRHAGGHGWMLGDEGSAVWLGLEGIRAALGALDGRGPRTLLARTVPEALGIATLDAGSTMQRIVRAAHARPPAQLGRLAPVVLDAAAGGDPVARALVDAAVVLLVDLVAAVMDDDEQPVIVLAGSLATKAPLINRPVRALLAERWPTALVAEVGSGEAGAVALAIGRHSGTQVIETTLARLRAASVAQHAHGSPPSSV